MPFLRPLPMAKIGVVGLKDDREVILSVLHDLRVVQVEPVSKEALTHLGPERSPELQRTVADQLVRVRGLLAALPPTPVSAPRTFPDLNAVLTETRGLSIDEEVGALKREEERLLTQRAEVLLTLELLDRFPFYQAPFGILRTQSLLAFFGEASPEVYDRIRVEVPALASATHFVESRGPKTVQFLVAVPTAQAETVGRLAQQRGVKLIAAPRLDGTPAEERPRLAQEAAALAARQAEIHARLTVLSQQWYGTLKPLEEALTIENRKLELYPKLGALDRSFALEGWIAARDRPRLAATLEGVTRGRTLLYDVPTTEEPPTVMENPRGVRWFEFFVRFYSIPQATEWDPTWTFALVFPILFGFMLGDVGYAAVILAISLWMVAGFPGGGKLPGWLRGIPKMVMPPNAMRQLAYALVPGCFVGIAMGVLTNAWFGFQLPYYHAAIDPLRNTAELLLFAGYLGLAMVVYGFALGALKEYFHHHPRAAGVKVAAIVICFSLAAMGLALLRGQLGANVIFLGLELAGLLGGAVAVVALAHGPSIGDKLMEAGLTFIEALSHILSFTRLVGILLASVILALVINDIGTGWSHAGIGWAIAGVALITFGAIFNVVLGVFEPGIQGMRLMFVEHFSKFYEGSGKPFQPFGARRTHTQSPLQP